MLLVQRKYFFVMIFFLRKMKLFAALFAYSTALEEYHGDKEMNYKIIL